MKWVDIPPVWLALCLVLGWWQSTYWTLGLGLGPVWADLLGGLLVGCGLLLNALAIYEFRRHRTTVIPHQAPTALITTGIFSRTRNPIYLGDALILAGFLLFWDAVLSLPLIPLFVWWIEKRFVVPEENRNRRIFRADFARYEQQTKRWL